MNLNRVMFKPSLLLSALLGSVMLFGCASAPTSQSAIESAIAPPTDNPMGTTMNEPAAREVAQAMDTATSSVPKAQPQLIKNAELELMVTSAEDSVEVISTILKAQQGELLGLQDQVPQGDRAPRTVSLRIRVPQNQLESTLDALMKLGTLQRRTVTAQDVSDQLVDYEARLRNLRASEASVLKIMERSGSVSAVLEVSRELSNIRNSIEQIDGQLTILRNQVAYSQITVNLQEAIALTPPQRSLGAQVEETWDQATHSVSEFTTDLMKLGIWLLAYSPYLLILMGTAFFGYRRLSQPSRPLTEEIKPSATQG